MQRRGPGLETAKILRARRVARRPWASKLGRTFVTPGARDALEQAGEDGRADLRRRAGGDWATVGAEDAQENELSVREGFRILSAYLTEKGVKLWLITEADLSATTILKPEEY